MNILTIFILFIKIIVFLTILIFKLFNKKIKLIYIYKYYKKIIVKKI